MRKGLQRILALGLVLLLAAAAALGEEAAGLLPALELPEAADGEFAILTESEDPQIGPHEEGYLFEPGEKSPWGYADPSITVRLGTGRVHNTNYMYARVKIADPMQLRTMMANESLKRNSTVMAHLLARRVQAVVAINGVLEADDMIAGPVVRQGVTLRPADNASASKLENWSGQESVDTLVIDHAGDLHILRSETWGGILEQIASLGDSAVNVISFGPGLIIDGEPQYGYNNRQMATHRLAQRMAICQTGPLEYLLITSEGPEDPGSTGLKLDEFTELLASFPEIINAYNLDGGSSSTLVFRKGSEYWAKVNCPRSGKKRPLKDLIYFADAWMPETPAGQETEGTP